MKCVKKYFGTDGIRGRVGDFPVNAEFVLKLGWAVGKVLGQRNNGKVIIGKDTRVSGYMLESALKAGLSAAGMNSFLLGPIPTPGIAYLTRTFRAEAGIVISASHNLFEDNGIKFFSSEGFKLNDTLESEIEYAIEKQLTTVPSENLGKVFRINDARGRYIEFCKSSIPHNTHFKDLKIVLDCANGATYCIAPNVFRELKADVISENVQPNGFNINANCGTTHPEYLQQRVLEEKADLGIAFDGDGDRVLMVDHQGEIVDGDELILIITQTLLDQNKLKGGIVGTHMSNMGLEVALKKLNIPFERTSVGDVHIMEALRERNWSLGGESSGHIVSLDVSTTGDGIITALQVLYAMIQSKKTLHELKKGMTKFPQITVSVPHNGQPHVLEKDNVISAIKGVEHHLNGKGRILVRKSGTEPVIRVMVEGETYLLVEELAHKIREIIEKNTIG